MQCKAPAQMHFIIAVIITEDSLEMWDSVCWGWGGFPCFSSAYFPYLTFLMPAIVSGRNYGDKFTAFMGAYTVMDLTTP